MCGVCMTEILCFCQNYILLYPLAKASLLCFRPFFFPLHAKNLPFPTLETTPQRLLSGPQRPDRAKDATCERQTSQLRVKETELIHFSRPFRENTEAREHREPRETSMDVRRQPENPPKWEIFRSCMTMASPKGSARRKLA